MAKRLREYTNCWVRHEPEIEVGKIEIVPPELVDVSVEITRAGKSDADASISLIERFCTAVKNDSDIDERLLRYIASALQVLVEDQNDLSGFARALGIKSTGRPRKNQERDREIYLAVRTHMSNGMTYENACELAGKNHCIEQSTVENIYKHRKQRYLKFEREMDTYSADVTDEEWTAIKELIEKEQSAE